MKHFFHKLVIIMKTLLFNNLESSLFLLFLFLFFLFLFLLFLFLLSFPS